MIDPVFSLLFCLQVYVGIVPSGTANAMANEIDRYTATSHVQ
jgi:diacylglycerol kinase family enzyme